MQGKFRKYVQKCFDHLVIFLPNKRSYVHIKNGNNFLIYAQEKVSLCLESIHYNTLNFKPFQFVYEKTDSYKTNFTEQKFNKKCCIIGKCD